MNEIYCLNIKYMFFHHCSSGIRSRRPRYLLVVGGRRRGKRLWYFYEKEESYYGRDPAKIKKFFSLKVCSRSFSFRKKPGKLALAKAGSQTHYSHVQRVLVKDWVWNSLKFRLSNFFQRCADIADRGVMQFLNDKEVPALFFFWFPDRKLGCIFLGWKDSYQLSKKYQTGENVKRFFLVRFIGQFYKDRWLYEFVGAIARF